MKNNTLNQQIEPTDKTNRYNQQIKPTDKHVSQPTRCNFIGSAAVSDTKRDLYPPTGHSLLAIVLTSIALYPPTGHSLFCQSLADMDISFQITSWQAGHE